MQKKTFPKKSPAQLFGLPYLGPSVFLGLSFVFFFFKMIPHLVALLCQLETGTIKKNTFESVLMRWMKLEPIIQSEVSQKEKHKYSILTHIYGI